MESTCKRIQLDPWVGKISWKRKWHPIPVLLGKSHGQRSLVGYSLWDHKESNMTQGLTSSKYAYV